jgi:hypothetical protein
LKIQCRYSRAGSSIGNVAYQNHNNKRPHFDFSLSKSKFALPSETQRSLAEPASHMSLHAPGRGRSRQAALSRPGLAGLDL